MLIVQVGQKLAMVEQEVEIAEDRANTGEMHGKIFYDLYAYVHIYILHMPLRIVLTYFLLKKNWKVK